MRGRLPTYMYVVLGKTNCIDRYMQTVMPLPSSEVEQQQNNLPDLPMPAGPVHQAYSGEGRCEKSDQRLGLKIGSWDTLGLLLKNPLLEVSL